MFSTLLGRIVVRVWIVLRIRADTSKDIEILVLRHQAGAAFLLVCPVGHLPPIVTLSRAQLTDWVAPTLQHYLVGTP